MAQITYRVSGLVDGKRVTRRFRNSPDGRREAAAFAKEVGDPRRFYDVRVRIKSPDGERSVTKTFPTKDQADEFAASVETDRRRGTALDPRRGAETFTEYAARWIDTRRVRGGPLAPKTRELYGVLLRVHIEPVFGALPLSDITPEAVRQWHARFASPMTAAKSYRLLRAIMLTAVTDGRIASSPCRVKDGGVERSPERPIVGPDVVLRLAEEIDPRFRGLVLLAGFGGLRLGEALGLRRRHIDLDAGTVRITEQVVTLSKGERLVTAPKTDAGVRTVHLPTDVVNALRDHLATAVGQDPDALLFPAVGGGLLPATTFYKEWRRVREAIGCPTLHLHDLRHAAGTLAAWTGATQRELMVRMGHASPAAALRYQHAAAGRDQAIASGLDAILGAMRETAAR